jgi:hypothetical protein
MNNVFIWLGIIVCLTQSAIFSGLNLAFFSLTRLRLEIEAEASPKSGAKKILSMRQDSNFLLATILWGNVGINVLLTLLSNSVMVGVVSFAFSTILITLFGEIIPQAYFSRNALRMASVLAPVIKLYQVVLYPVAKPSALLLDFWLGKELTQFFTEKNIKLFLKKHIEGSTTEIGHIEGTGAINFLSLDDMTIDQEGENICPDSIVPLETRNGEIIFPPFSPNPDDPFVQKINRSGKNWIILTDEKDQPRFVLDADSFIRSALFCKDCNNIEDHCHKPIILKDKKTALGKIMLNFKNKENIHSDVPYEKDIVLYWTRDVKRIITGADILGRLLKGL